MNEAEKEAALLAVRVERLVSYVFAFEWCPCIYESAFGLVSLHTTKRGAFKEMILTANKRWHEDRWRHLSGGYGKPRPKGCDHEAWRVIRIEVHNA